MHRPGVKCAHVVAGRYAHPEHLATLWRRRLLDSHQRATPQVAPAGQERTHALGSRTRWVTSIAR